MTELGRGVDPFELDLLERPPRGVDEHRLAESHDTLLDTRNRALDHDEVVVDLAVANEATQTVQIVSSVLGFLQHDLELGRTYGVIFFLVTSSSVAALSSASALPMR